MFSHALRRPATARTSQRCFSASSRRSADANVLCFIETKVTDKSDMVPGTLNAITAAKKIGGKVTGILIGKDEASMQPAIDKAKKSVPPLRSRSLAGSPHRLAFPLPRARASKTRDQGGLPLGLEQPRSSRARMPSSDHWIPHSRLVGFFGNPTTREHDPLFASATSLDDGAGFLEAGRLGRSTDWDVP